MDLYIVKGQQSYQASKLKVKKNSATGQRFCKVTVHQTLKMIISSGTQPRLLKIGCNGRCGRFFQTSNFEGFYLFSPLTNRTKKPLWKDLSKNILSTQDASNVFKISFAYSQWPHYHSNDGGPRIVLILGQREKTVLFENPYYLRTDLTLNL